MAFKMNRPIIKGTPLHKASIAKAVDASLIEKANVLGMSDVPHAIDYGLKMPDIDVKRKKKEKDDDETATTEEVAQETAEDLEELGEKKTKEAQAAGQERVDQAKQQEEIKVGQFTTQRKLEGELVPNQELMDKELDVSEKKSGRLPTYDEAWDMNK